MRQRPCITTILQDERENLPTGIGVLSNTMKEDSTGTGKDFFKLGCGGLMLAFGMLMALGVVVGRADSEYSLATDMVGLFLMGVIPAGLGIWVLRRTLLSKKRGVAERNERILFDVAKQHAWVLTPVDLARESPMNLAESQAALDQMVRLGHAELDVDGGGLCYRFIRPDTAPKVEVLDPLAAKFAELEKSERASKAEKQVEEEDEVY